MGLPGPVASRCGARRAAEPGARQRTQTSAPPHPRERRSGSQSPRTTARRRRAHACTAARSPARPPAARTRGRTPPHTHTRCTLPALPAPPLSQETAGSRTPRGPHPMSPDPSHPSALGLRDRGPLEAGCHRGCNASSHRGGRHRAGASQRCTHTARPARTRGEEEGAAPCLGLAQWLA